MSDRRITDPIPATAPVDETELRRIIASIESLAWRVPSRPMAARLSDIRAAARIVAEIDALPSELEGHKRLLQLVEHGTIPRPVNYNGNILWHTSDIEEYHYIKSDEDVRLQQERTKDAAALPTWAEAVSRQGPIQDIVSRLAKFSDEDVKLVLAFAEAVSRREVGMPVPQKLWSEQPRKRGEGYVSPSDFIRQNYRYYYEHDQLSEDDLRDADPELLHAYRNRIRSYPNERLPKLRKGLTAVEREIRKRAPHLSLDEVRKWGQALSARHHRAK